MFSSAQLTFKTARNSHSTIQFCFRGMSSQSGPPGGLPAMPAMQHLKKFYKHASVVPHPDSDSFPKLKASDDVTYDNLSLSHGPYWAVALDGRIIKTIYKDPMPIPSRALAVAIAEEWES